MESVNLVIADQDSEYLENFMNYFYSKQGGSFSCCAFTDIKKLLSYAAENRIDILLISSEMVSDEVRRLPAADVIVLDEGEQETQDNVLKSVNRYQAADGIIREIMKSCDEKRVPGLQQTKKSDTEFIAVFSPVKRALKTSFAITLAQFLSEKGKTLYVNMEMCSGFSQIFMKNFDMDLSDLLFSMKGRKDSILYKLQSAVVNVQGVDYIPPVMSPSDIMTVSDQEWIEFLENVSVCGYRYVILDIGDYVHGLSEIMKKCVKIYMPERQDDMSKAKMAQFEALLRISGNEGILPYIKRLNFPFFSDIGSPADDLKQTELGKYVKSLIKEMS